jgi:hypothetical protein
MPRRLEPLKASIDSIEIIDLDGQRNSQKDRARSCRAGRSTGLKAADRLARLRRRKSVIAIGERNST